MMPISIITPSLNQENTIGKCLNSVSIQSVEKEQIIIDGASTDSTLDILRKQLKEGLKFISEPDQGPYDAMNKGVRMAGGGIIGILNADDFYPEADILETVVRTMERTGADSCYGDLEYVERDNTEKVVGLVES